MGDATFFDKPPPQIETVKHVFPHEDLVFPQKTLRLTFTQGIQLRESGWKDDDGTEPSEDDDLSTATERRLGQLVKERYGTDYFILGVSLPIRPS